MLGAVGVETEAAWTIAPASRDRRAPAAAAAASGAIAGHVEAPDVGVHTSRPRSPASTCAVADLQGLQPLHEGAQRPTARRPTVGSLLLAAEATCPVSAMAVNLGCVERSCQP